MGIEMGAKIAVFPVDDLTRDHLTALCIGPGSYTEAWADPDAEYWKELDYDLDAVEPVVAAPHTVDNVKPTSTMAGITIHIIKTTISKICKPSVANMDTTRFLAKFTEL